MYKNWCGLKNKLLLIFFFLILCQIKFLIPQAEVPTAEVPTADTKLTTSQEQIQALDNFLKEIADPQLSISDKIQKYDKGFDELIKKDTAATTVDSFLMSFIGFVTTVSNSVNASIDELSKTLDLIIKMRASDKLPIDQQNKLSVGLADAIRRKYEIQKLFKDQLEKAARAVDFKDKLGWYRGLFRTNLTAEINIDNRQLLVNGIGQLVSAASSKAALEDVKSFLDDVLVNKFNKDKRDLLSAEQQKQLRDYRETATKKLGEMKSVSSVEDTKVGKIEPKVPTPTPPLVKVGAVEKK